MIRVKPQPQTQTSQEPLPRPFIRSSTDTPDWRPTEGYIACARDHKLPFAILSSEQGRLSYNDLKTWVSKSIDSRERERQVLDAKLFITHDAQQNLYQLALLPSNINANSAFEDTRLAKHTFTYAPYILAPLSGLKGTEGYSLTLRDILAKFAENSSSAHHTSSPHTSSPRRESQAHPHAQHTTSASPQHPPLPPRAKPNPATSSQYPELPPKASTASHPKPPPVKPRQQKPHPHYSGAQAQGNSLPALASAISKYPVELVDENSIVAAYQSLLELKDHYQRFDFSQNTVFAKFSIQSTGLICDHLTYGNPNPDQVMTRKQFLDLLYKTQSFQNTAILTLCNAAAEIINNDVDSLLTLQDYELILFQVISQLEQSATNTPSSSRPRPQALLEPPKLQSSHDQPKPRPPQPRPRTARTNPPHSTAVNSTKQQLLSDLSSRIMALELDNEDPAVLSNALTNLINAMESNEGLLSIPPNQINLYFEAAPSASNPSAKVLKLTSISHCNACGHKLMTKSDFMKLVEPNKSFSDNFNTTYLYDQALETLDLTSTQPFTLADYFKILELSVQRISLQQKALNAAASKSQKKHSRQPHPPKTTSSEQSPTSTATSHNSKPVVKAKPSPKATPHDIRSPAHAPVANKPLSQHPITPPHTHTHAPNIGIAPMEPSIADMQFEPTAFREIWNTEAHLGVALSRALQDARSFRIHNGLTHSSQPVYMEFKALMEMDGRYKKVGVAVTSISSRPFNPAYTVRHFLNTLYSCADQSPNDLAMPTLHACANEYFSNHLDNPFTLQEYECFLHAYRLMYPELIGALAAREARNPYLHRQPPAARDLNVEEIPVKTIADYPEEDPPYVQAIFQQIKSTYDSSPRPSSGSNHSSPSYHPAITPAQKATSVQAKQRHATEKTTGTAAKSTQQPAHFLPPLNTSAFQAISGKHDPSLVEKASADLQKFKHQRNIDNFCTTTPLYIRFHTDMTSEALHISVSTTPVHSATLTPYTIQDFIISLRSTTASYHAPSFEILHTLAKSHFHSADQKQPFTLEQYELFLLSIQDDFQANSVKQAKKANQAAERHQQFLERKNQEEAREYQKTQQQTHHSRGVAGVPHERNMYDTPRTQYDLTHFESIGSDDNANALDRALANLHAFKMHHNIRDGRLLNIHFGYDRKHPGFFVTSITNIADTQNYFEPHQLIQVAKEARRAHTESQSLFFINTMIASHFINSPKMQPLTLQEYERFLTTKVERFREEVANALLKSQGSDAI